MKKLFLLACILIPLICKAQHLPEDNTPPIHNAHLGFSSGNIKGYIEYTLYEKLSDIPILKKGEDLFVEEHNLIVIRHRSSYPATSRSLSIYYPDAGYNYLIKTVIFVDSGKIQRLCGEYLIIIDDYKLIIKHNLRKMLEYSI